MTWADWQLRSAKVLQAANIFPAQAAARVRPVWIHSLAVQSLLSTDASQSQLLRRSLAAWLVEPGLLFKGRKPLELSIAIFNARLLSEGQINAVTKCWWWWRRWACREHQGSMWCTDMVWRPHEGWAVIVPCGIWDGERTTQHLQKGPWGTQQWPTQVGSAAQHTARSRTIGVWAEPSQARTWWKDHVTPPEFGSGLISFTAAR